MWLRGFRGRGTAHVRLPKCPEFRWGYARDQGYDGTSSYHPSDEDGEVTVRLPKGDYTLNGSIHPDSTSDLAVLVQPKLRLDKDTTVDVDARQAQPVDITVPDTPTEGVTRYTVPAQDSTYHLTLDNSRDPAVYPVSTRVRAEWTFRSGKTPGNEPTALPLSVIRFSPALTLSSTAEAGKRFEVPFGIEGTAAGQRPEKLAFEVSYDEGATWQPTKAVGGTHLSLRTRRRRAPSRCGPS